MDTRSDVSSLELADWLERGLGRAILHVRQHPARPYRETIAYACTHNLVYDAQCEPSRAPYLLDLIRAAGEPEYYRDRVLAALSESEDGDRLVQLFELAGLLAESGDERARRAMYAAFERNAPRRQFTGAEEIVVLDGLDGFLFVLEQVERHGTPEDDGEIEACVWTLEERLGEDAAGRELTRIGARLPRVSRVLVERREARERRRGTPRPNPARPYRFSYSELRRLIATVGPRAGAALWNWGQSAAAEDLSSAAEDLLAERDPERLRAYLRVFRRRAFPLELDRLVELARHGEARLAEDALRALANTTHPTVRSLALELENDPDRRHHAVDLLNATYQPGDHRLVESLLEKPADRDHTHWLGSAVLRFARAHPGPANARALTLLYEVGPCTHCRGDCVKLLIEMDCLPEWMRRECRWDCDEETRGLVAGMTD